MSFTDTPSGRSLPALTATAAFHALLLLAFAAGFEISQTSGGEARAPSLSAFNVEEARPAPARTEEKPPIPPKEPPQSSETLSVAPSEQGVSQAPAKPNSVSVPAIPMPEPLRILPANAPAPSPAPGSDFAKPDPLTAYTQQIRRQILANRPTGVRKEGETVISFTLLQGGELTESHIARSSGDPQLDRLASRTLRQSAPFPPPPPEIPESALTFAIAIRFH